MKRQPQPLILVDPGERHSLRLGESVLHYRRLSLGALAAIERQQAQVMGQGQDAPLQVWLPPAALEAAICAQALLGWEGGCKTP